MEFRFKLFEAPENIKMTQVDNGEMSARFEAAPFPSGIGHTMGNTIRRLLMITLQSPGIISVKIDGASHEYVKVEGIIEDMTDIVLNIKGARIRAPQMKALEQIVVSKKLVITSDDMGEDGQKHVYLEDLIDATSNNLELVNPKLHIFTATQPLEKDVQFRIECNRGYVPSERHVIEDMLEGEIAIDTAFSPVSMVNYRVEDTRVGQQTDLDKLILDIETDGRVTPEEALSLSSQIGTHFFGVFDSENVKFVTVQEEESHVDTEYEELLEVLAKPVTDIELSVRSGNCLKSAGIDMIHDLVFYSINDLLKLRNFGKKSADEIGEKLVEMGLSLEFDKVLKKYGKDQKQVLEDVADYKANNS